MNTWLNICAREEDQFFKNMRPDSKNKEAGYVVANELPICVKFTYRISVPFNVDRFSFCCGYFSTPVLLVQLERRIFFCYFSPLLHWSQESFHNLSAYFVVPPPQGKVGPSSEVDPPFHGPKMPSCPPDFLVFTS